MECCGRVSWTEVIQNNSTASLVSQKRIVRRAARHLRGMSLQSCGAVVSIFATIGITQFEPEHLNLEVCRICHLLARFRIDLLQNSRNRSWHFSKTSRLNVVLVGVDTQTELPALGIYHSAHAVGAAEGLVLLESVPAVDCDTVVPPRDIMLATCLIHEYNTASTYQTLNSGNQES